MDVVETTGDQQTSVGPGWGRVARRAAVPSVLFLLWAAASLYVYALHIGGFGLPMLLLSMAFLIVGIPIVAGQVGGLVVGVVASAIFFAGVFLGAPRLGQDVVLHSRGETVQGVVTRTYVSRTSRHLTRMVCFTVPDDKSVHPCMEQVPGYGYSEGRRIPLLVDPQDVVDPVQAGSLDPTKHIVMVSLAGLAAVAGFTCGALMWRGKRREPVSTFVQRTSL